MQDDTATPPEPVGDPLSVPVPQLDAQPPEGEIVGLASSQAAPEAPRRGRPPADGVRSPLIPGESKQERHNRLNRERKARKRAEAKGKPAPAPRSRSATSGPARAPGVPFPGEDGAELGTDELPPGVSREEMNQLGGALALSFGIASTFAATTWGKHWELSGEETDKLGSAWAPVLAPYLAGLGAAAPWVTATLVTGGILLPHAMAHLAARDNPQLPPAPDPIEPPTREPDLPREGVPPPPPTGPAAPVGGNKIRPPKGKKAPE